MLDSLIVVLAVLAGGLAPVAAQTTERVADIQVHGNTLTPDARVVELAGVHIGSPVTSSTVDDIGTRLRGARLFQRVEVLKRFASIADASQIAIVIVVDEGPVRIVAGEDGAPATVEPRRGPQLMYLPILTFEDGYGLTYGAQMSIPEPFGPRSRVAFPATWGGEKRAAAELEAPLSNRVLTRVRAGGEIARRTNPFFDADDDRRRLWARAERDLGRSVRVGATGAFEHISFLGTGDRIGQIGVDATVDTRVDPFLARNAVYGRVAWELLRFDQAADARSTDVEARGYVGLPRQMIMVVGGIRQDANRALPPALSPILGGTANLRGFEAGSAVGDTLVAASAELRVPLTSPLSIGKLGVSAFMDVGSVYDEGGRVRDQKFERGIGAGIWLSATFVRASISIAHGLGGTTRAHVGVTASF